MILICIVNLLEHWLTQPLFLHQEADKIAKELIEEEERRKEKTKKNKRKKMVGICIIIRI